MLFAIIILIKWAICAHKKTVVNTVFLLYLLLHKPLKALVPLAKQTVFLWFYGGPRAPSTITKYLIFLAEVRISLISQFLTHSAYIYIIPYIWRQVAKN